MQPPIPFPSAPHEPPPPRGPQDDEEYEETPDEEPPSMGKLLSIGDMDPNRIPPSEPAKFMDDDIDELLDDDELDALMADDFEEDLYEEEDVPVPVTPGKKSHRHHHHLEDEL